MAEFRGFSQKALTFLGDLKDNNERSWFNERKELYKEEIVAPAIAFIEELGGRLQSISPQINYDVRTNGSGSLMRIYRDVRFSKDKKPYKTNVGIIFWQGSGKKTECPGYYFHMTADEAWIGGGLHIFPKHLLEPYREAVADTKKANALRQALSDVEEVRLKLSSESYKRIPRGYDNDHPQADLLKYKGLYTTKSIPRNKLYSPSLIETCFEICQQAAPLQQWFAKNLS